MGVTEKKSKTNSNQLLGKSLGNALVTVEEVGKRVKRLERIQSEILKCILTLAKAQTHHRQMIEESIEMVLEDNDETA